MKKASGCWGLTEFNCFQSPDLVTITETTTQNFGTLYGVLDTGNTFFPSSLAP